MHSRKFARSSAKVIAGGMSIEDYLKMNFELIRSYAIALDRRWKSPLSKEDVMQEVFMAVVAVIRAGRYDPTRETSAADYIVWNSLDKAKKRIHKARGAKLSGNADSNPSRTPVLSTSEDDTPKNSGSVWATPAPSPEELTCFYRDYKKLDRSTLTDFQQVSLTLLAETCDFRLTAEQIYYGQPHDFLIKHRLGGVEQTETKVKRELQKLVA